MLTAKSTIITTLGALSLLCTHAALAGGAIAYEIGTPDLGLAAAGYAARAQDAATAVTNPAGMTRLKQSELLLGPQIFYGGIEFSPNTLTTVPGNDGGNPVGWFPGGGVYYVHSESPCLKYGLSLYSNFGSLLRYNDGWVGRYHGIRSALLDFTLAPSIAYKLNPMWSIGAALNVVYGLMSTTTAVNNSPLGLFNTPDGEFKVKDETWSFGGTFGVLFEPTPCMRYGLTYNTKTELNFGSTIRFSDTLPAIIPGGSLNVPLDLSMNVPQAVMASGFYQFSRQWALLGNIGWQDWSDFGRVEVTVGSANPQNFTSDAHYSDTWHAALGAQYTICPTWRLSFGAAFDSSMLSDANRTVTLPIGHAWRFGLGAQYFMCKNFDIGFAYELLWAGDLPIDQTGGILLGHLAGSFDNTTFQYFGISFNFKL